MGAITCPPPPLPFPTTLFHFFTLIVVAIIVDELPPGTFYAAASNATANITRCHALERRALIEFKGRLLDPVHRLSSWVGEDCCEWEGVGCSSVTGHVLKLDLRNRHGLDPYDDCAAPYEWPDSGCKWALQGEISESLLSLRHLRHLDLSANSFRGKPIPKHLGSLRSLTYLNLSTAGFIGRVPAQLGNLTNLHSLDLSYNANYYYYYDDVDTSASLYLKGTGWISQLTSLRHLKINRVDFTNASNWLGALNALAHIQVLELSECGLINIPGSLSHVNFTSLTTLDLSDNNDLDSIVPEWLFNITTLEYLDLGGTLFSWPSVPRSIAKLSSLRTLDLSQNKFQNATKMLEALSDLCNLQNLILSGMPLNDELINRHVVFSNSCLTLGLEELHLDRAELRGPLPGWLGSMKNLKHLDLSGNSLYGSLSASLGSLSLLQYLDVRGNGLNGTIAQGMLMQMKELIYLGTGGNSLILAEEYLANLSSLKELHISQNTLVLNKGAPDWIPPFQLSSLDMFSCKILPKPQIPKWIQTQRALSWLDISSAGIRGNIPIRLPTALQVLDLSNNQITGHLPDYLPNITYLDLSNNSFSGQIYPIIAEVMSSIDTIDLSMNNLSGSISSSICQLKFLYEFRISKNKLWGSKLPDCWKNSFYLETMDFSYNRLQGEIPRSLCNLRVLYILHLNNNDLSGQIPSCLKRCKRLIALDLSYNRFSGNIPTQIGESLSELQRLNLHFNALTGSIPSQLSALTHLQILDLSNNNLSGIIPRSFGNFSALQRHSFDNTDYDDTITVFTKGMESNYGLSMLSYVKLIDLSNNRLIGHIPKELGDLQELHGLNLSKNYLTGEIPDSIKGLQQLEVLDLSRNNLSGPIPLDLAALKFLAILNLSYNNISGKIPTGTQLQTFGSSSYIGNPNLCGFPLPKNCTNNDEEELGEDDEHRIEIIILYASISLGFIIGFWATCGTLILQRRWRYAYFRYIDGVYDKIYVAVAVKLANFRRK